MGKYACVIVAAAAVFIETAVAQVGSISQPLTGAVNFEDCSPAQTDFLKDANKYGRIASVSAGFEACIRDRVTNRYRRCPGEPFAEASTAVQIDRVLEVSKAPNSVRHVCTHSAGIGNAWAGFNEYAHDDTVAFSWGLWLDSIVLQLPKRICSEAEKSDPDANNCRWGAYPWPYTQAAGTTWHEGMHTHRYTHGDADDRGRAGCGYAASSDYDMWTHAMPYIVGSCINDAIETAQNVCTRSVNSCPGANQLRMESADGGACSCVNDPGQKGLGLLAVRDNKIRDTAILPTGQRARDGWLYADRNTIVASGNFDGAGAVDLLVASDWGLGVLTTDEDGGWRTLTLTPTGERIGGWRLNSRGDTFEGVGDFDGDGRDEFIIRSEWGVGVVGYDDGAFRLLDHAPRNTWFDDWRWDAREVNGGRDEIAGVGDLNGDGRDEIVVKSNWGIGALTLRSGRLRRLAIAQRDTWFGSWRWDARVNAGRDVIEGVADLNGDGRDEILVTSTWGIGVLALAGERFNAIVAKPTGASFRPWRYQARGTANPHSVEAIGDFNGDGAADILLKSRGAIGALRVDGDTFRQIAGATDGRRLGGWLLATRDNTIEGAGDLDGTGGDEILIRSDWGLGALRVSRGSFVSTELVKNETLAGSWRLAPSDRMIAVARSATAPADMLIIQKTR
ncbi:MAG: VCBS repeat-containing protein [Pseudomonadota bacterium]